MAKVKIDIEKCKGCFLCVSFCPKRLIKPDSKLNRRGVRPAKMEIDSQCLGCAMCAVICPDCCIEIYK
ncbi:MAG: 4Fe-4S dicluster domain-containing protein [Candidatus Omnitrophica bacterium]|nr:4Fe-4S dicluster domain-containing protein [Candidatus Omnitrophota bacterium]MDD5552501.1 4Fe-4S dicluster domain-containing protein [Candidatus Omnitrophota bacterium]